MRRQSLLSWDSLLVVFALLNVWMIQSSVSAFLPSHGILGSCSSSTSVRTTLRRMMQRDEFVRQIWTATAFTGMLSNVVPASAEPLSHPQSVWTSSSTTVHVAASIKELDMSLPSYDDIKSYKASVENVKSLSVDPKKSGGLGIAASAKKRGGNPVTNILPSMNKEGPKVKKEKNTSPDGYIF